MSKSTNPDIICLHDQDNVAVALRDLPSGHRLEQTRPDGSTARLSLKQAIPAGHKLATASIPLGQAVRKFGWPIGYATATIEPGEHVHTQNVRCEHKPDLDAVATDLPATPKLTRRYSFRGYERADGKVGTRNYLAVISNVNCSASVARMIARHFDEAALRDFPNVDGVISFRHEGGCAMAFGGSRHRMLSQVLGGMAKHPNIGGFLLVGLGCEQGTLDHLVESQQLHSIQLPKTAVTSEQGLGSDMPASEQSRGGDGGLGKSPAAAIATAPRTTTAAQQIPVLSIQASGGTQQTVRRGIEIVKELLPLVNAAERTEQSASKLILGTECGGSDGYSGITANPALGAAADLLVACGGTAILSETSEIFGAEHLLTRRARSRAVAEKLLEKIEWWKWYSEIYGEELDNNPSVGNKAGGLTTITEKSLGAVSKGGSTPLEAVYDYAHPVDSSGFVVMDSPGFDPASVTGMVAGGANLIAFTTGRGSCFGFKPTPSFKIASNRRLFERMPDDMDFHAGEVVEGRSVEEVGHDLFVRLLATASGEKTCSEQLGIGDEEFVPWLVGPVL